MALSLNRNDGAFAALVSLISVAYFPLNRPNSLKLQYQLLLFHEQPEPKYY